MTRRRGPDPFSGKHHLLKGARELRVEDLPARVRETFASKLRPGDGGCLLWTGARNGDGYGHLRIANPPATRIVLAHRVAYAIAFGVAPGSLVLDHTCEVRLCCFTGHLRATTEEGNTPGIYGAPPLVRAPAPRRYEGWGPPCRCAHKWLIHRGRDHLGACAALDCAVLDERGRAIGSRCASFRELEAPAESSRANTWSDERVPA